MSASRRPSGWLPPFVVGVAAAVAAEISVGLLLYSGEGLLRALTLILAVLMGALALGLHGAPPADGVVESLRRRWLFLLVAFVLAAVTAGVWDLLGGLSGGAASRGVGLAFLAGLPLYAVGGVLGGMAVERRRAGATAPFAAAAAGAAAGAVLTGLLLVPRIHPLSTFVGCVVLLSAGALAHGRLLDRRPRRRVLHIRPSPLGDVSVEERGEAGHPNPVRVLLEDGRVRAVERRGGSGEEARVELEPWEAAAAALARSAADGRGGRFLVLGGGGLTLARGLLRDGGAAVDVVESNPVVADVAREHLGAGRAPEGLRVVPGHPGPEGVWPAVPGPYDAVILDGRGGGAAGPLPLPPEAALAAVVARRAPGAPVVVGPVRLPAGAGAPLDALAERLPPGVRAHLVELSAADGETGTGVVVLLDGELDREAGPLLPADARAVRSVGTAREPAAEPGAPGAGGRTG